MQKMSKSFLFIVLVIGVFSILLTKPISAQTNTPQTPTITPNPTPANNVVLPQSTASTGNQTPTILEIVDSIATIATPIVVLMLTGLGWSIRNRVDRAKELEEKLREDRIQIYNDILEPYIMLFTKGKPASGSHKNKLYSELGAEKVSSLEYKQAAFKLSLIGSDEVLSTFNDLMQFFYTAGEIPEDAKEMHTLNLLSLFGKLMLEIRKSVGNESTKLNNFEMLEFLINDLRKFQKDGKYPSALTN